MTSIHDKLERVRKPRVHIKYEIETESGSMQKELPFVVGVMGDFSGNNPGKELKPLRERKFITIDRDNFNDVMRSISPGLNLTVPNVFDKQNSDLHVELQFKSIEDFEPTKLVEQITPLRELKQARDKLRDLLTKTDRSDQLEQLLEGILQDSQQLQLLAQQLETKETP